MISSEDEALGYCRARFKDPAIIEKLQLYASLLTAENSRQNLVSSDSLSSIWQRHIVDSLQLLEHAPKHLLNWLDLGTGAGPPGLLIAIARPQTHFMLVECRKRRVGWLTSARDNLDLKNCDIIGKKLEDIESASFDCISARAFAPLHRLLNLSGRFATPETTWLLPKGQSAEKELANQSTGIGRMFHVERSITDRHAGIVVGKGIPEFS